MTRTRNNDRSSYSSTSMPATFAFFIRAQAATKTVAGSVLCRPTMSRATWVAVVTRFPGARWWRRARRARRSSGVNFRIVAINAPEKDWEEGGSVAQGDREHSRSEGSTSPVPGRSARFRGPREVGDFVGYKRRVGPVFFLF